MLSGTCHSESPVIKKHERYISYRGPQNTVQLPVYDSSGYSPVISIPEEENGNNLQGEPGQEKMILHHQSTLE